MHLQHSQVIGVLQARLVPPAQLTPQQVADGVPQPARLSEPQVAAVRAELALAMEELKAVHARRAKCAVTAVRIVHRHHFSSALQR